MTDRERLIELIRKAKKNTKGANCDLEREMLFADCLLENGVIVPPCKVGDTIYWIDNGKIKQSEVFEISIHSDGILVHTGIQFCLEVEQVFLTREEAEKALAERSNKQ